MSFAYFAVLSVILCWKWGNWRNWKEFYPTIIYIIMGNLAYMVLTQSKPLWKEGGILGQYPCLAISSMVVLYASTVILYLTFLPRMHSMKKRLAYIALWIVIYSVMELISFLTGQFYYYNGWRFIYSVIFNMFMFPLLLLHHHKPLLAWPISAVLAYALMSLFDIPFKI